MPYLNYIFILYSSIVKGLSKVHVPKPLRRPFFKMFGRTFMGMNSLDFKELDTDLSGHKDISEFFSRSIDLGSRPLSDHDLVSPCDGIISEYGNINSKDQTMKVKGLDYSLNELLKDESLCKSLENGSYIVIYLSPRNYHRFHTPLSGNVAYFKHIPGYAFPVNKAGLMLAGNVYAKNERVILSINSKDTKLCMAIVGACAVRGIKMLKGDGDAVSKGQELGRFELGSSIVLISDKRLFPNYEPVKQPIKARGSLFQ